MFKIVTIPVMLRVEFPQGQTVHVLKAVTIVTSEHLNLSTIFAHVICH